jgi:hypothetical protein
MAGGSGIAPRGVAKAVRHPGPRRGAAGACAPSR